ncbi:hypothetical protein [Salinibaculum salinum]|uniref:hypothetical protein n=1 Tax=Salinibaculum salinum TaxID=3131996 RepID=UPI0030ED78A2
MAECARCNDFTDNTAEGEYHYCNDCLQTFQEIEQHGVVVEDTDGGDVHVIVTAHETSFDGGTESSQVDGLARAKYIADETGLDGLFKYGRSGSRWVLDEYLEAHPEIRQDVHERLSRVPETKSAGLIDKIKSIL